jgi:hypothetical protein
MSMSMSMSMKEQIMSDGPVHEMRLAVGAAIPAEYYAGADMALKVRVSCSSACDLRGKAVTVVTRGAAVAEMKVELTELEGEIAETGEFVVKAPAKPGEYTWTLLIPAFKKKGVHHDRSSMDFNFTVKAHQVFMLVWDVPSPVIMGGEFTVAIGAKCSAGCSLAGMPFVVENNDHVQVAAGNLWQEELPQARDLYWVERALIAPSEEGLYEWSARVVTTDLRLQHEVTPMEFPFFAAKPPDCVVTVEVVDKSQQTPLKNAAIFLDRRRATTDEHGIARVEVTKGTHELHVAREHYEPFQMAVEIDGDTTIRAELRFEPDIASIGNV